MCCKVSLPTHLFFKKKIFQSFIGWSSFCVNLPFKILQSFIGWQRNFANSKVGWQRNFANSKIGWQRNFANLFFDFKNLSKF